MTGTRADVRLTELGLAESREKAKSLIMAGVVYRAEVKIEKPGETVSSDCALTVREDPVPYVSRGGLKLEKAVKKYSLDLNGVTAADIGASTGGFTDCMLQNGAKKVYSIDVGYGQLDWKLRNDERVVVMERTNARNIEPDWFNEVISFVSVDVSFISLRLILPGLYNTLCDGAYAVTLVKPQFEAGRGKVGKNGIVRDPDTHAEVLSGIACFAHEIGFAVLHMDFSPIKGPKGNVEFLLVLRKNGSGIPENELIQFSRHTVALAHEELDRD